MKLGNLLIRSTAHLVLLSSVLVAPAPGAHRGFLFQAQVELLDCDGTPCVQASVGGRNVKLGIDTGNEASVLDTKMANAAGIKPSAPSRGGAPAGTFRITIPEVKVGAVTLTAVPGLAMDLTEMIEHQQMPQVDGTLAYTAFKNRVVQLDFRNHKLSISDVDLKPEDAPASSCEKIELITFGKEGPPIVVAKGFELNGKKLSAQVDTMFTGSLLVYSTAVEKLGLTTESKTEETEYFPLTDGGVQMKVAAVKQEAFRGRALTAGSAKVYFPTPDVHEPDNLFDATVGLALLRDTVLILDFRAMTICIV
jgi:hypothetical protein